MMKFTECLNDTWDYFFLGDPANISKFQKDNNLSEDLMSDFTTNESGDLVVEKGVMIPLSGIANYPYTIYFQVEEKDSVFNDTKNDLQFKKTGYILQVINNEVYLMTLPYLKRWTEDGAIKDLKSNGLRPEISLANGYYEVEILGGETQQETGWEPTLEFLFKKVKQFNYQVEDVNFKFSISSREY